MPAGIFLPTNTGVYLHECEQIPSQNTANMPLPLQYLQRTAPLLQSLTTGLLGPLLRYKCWVQFSFPPTVAQPKSS
uniref:Uncharacterized protein n=1 Tax=Anguilla anguilla TaxID=7936 RepID=A0A0E9WH11_ANGAN